MVELRFQHSCSCFLMRSESAAVHCFEQTWNVYEISVGEWRGSVCVIWKTGVCHFLKTSHNQWQKKLEPCNVWYRPLWLSVELSTCHLSFEVLLRCNKKHVLLKALQWSNKSETSSLGASIDWKCCSSRHPWRHLWDRWFAVGGQVSRKSKIWRNKRNWVLHAIGQTPGEFLANMCLFTYFFTF